MRKCLLCANHCWWQSEKVRERSLATIFQSQSEADNIKHKYKKKLKTYKLEPITVQNIEPVKTAEQECKRKSVSKTLRTQVYNLAEGHCAICGDFVPYEDFTVDHIFPVSKGGKMNCLICSVHVNHVIQ